MSSKNDQQPTSFTNPTFDNESLGGKMSGNPSPMGSNIFIVKPDDKAKDRSHPEPFRHEPVTQKNIGRSILRFVRGKFFNII